ncbi:putative inactive receptor kinase [Abeliophyllum distichum]|uniref:Inactive receptor kinase n=1 Tax=Abeliophyllum distichum TaxID=126358 RepID=A0ABD1URQ5_9LAMI
MYRSSRDNWERLVEAVLRREQLRATALDDSWSLSTASASNSHYILSSSLPGLNMMEDMRSHGDLLSAYGEILARGTFGFTYSAQLKNGPTMVVKALTEVSVTIVEFEQQMKFLGSIKHDNVVIPRGYHFSEDYKFILYNHYSRGSVSAMLHDKKGGNGTPLNWMTRLRIAIGTARGIAHIHTEHGGGLIHGNIKASNIFLNSHAYGCISDLGFSKLISPTAPPFMWVAGYAAPEVMDSGKVSQASDAYSFGVLLLELLTGKSPTSYRGDCEYEVQNFVRWVHCMVSEGLDVAVFDAQIFRHLNVGELEQILEIGMSCAARVPDHRPKMSDVVKMMENVRELDEDFEFCLTPEPRSSDYEVSF